MPATVAKLVSYSGEHEVEAQAPMPYALLRTADTGSRSTMKVL